MEIRLLLVLILLIAFSGCGGVSMHSENNQVQVDPKVLQKLASSQRVPVIVLLKFTERPDQPREVQISNIQEQVLNQLPSGEFKLKGRFSSIPGFAVEISTKAFNILKSNPHVLSVSNDGISYPHSI